MKGSPPMPTQSTKRTASRAFTLVEVIVSMLILSMSSIGLTSLFLQNMRYSNWQTHNVHITNTTFGIADQIKNLGANELWRLFQDTTNDQTINVITVDPSDAADGYKTLALKINQKDIKSDTQDVSGNVVNAAWNTVTLKLGRLSTSPSIPVSYWITVRHKLNTNNGTPLRDVLEFTLIYKWSVPGNKNITANQIQLTFPAPNYSFN